MNADDQRDPQPEQHAEDPAAPTPAPTPPHSPRRRFSRRATITAVAVVAVLAAGGSAVYAATDEDAAPVGATALTAGTPGGIAGEAPGRFGRAGLARALHGEFVVATDTGTETRLLQIGEVTKLTDTSITVASSDDYTKTYAVTSSTVIDHGRQSLKDLATGDIVTVVASTSGDTATAIVIDDRETRDRHRYGIPHRWHAEPFPAEPFPAEPLP